MDDLQSTRIDRMAEPNAEYITDVPITHGLVVEKAKIAEGGEYNLSGERYRVKKAIDTIYELVPIGRFLRPNVKSIDPRKMPDEVFELWSIPAYDVGKPDLVRGGDIGSSKKAVYPNDVLLSRIIPHIRRAWVVKKNSNNQCQIASTEWIVFSSNELIPEFLRHVIVSDPFHVRFMQTITGVGGSLSRANTSAVADIQIPLPPLEVQKEIVAEIEGYQKVIDGARAVIDNYHPHIAIDPKWPMVTVGEVCNSILSGGTPSTKNKDYWNGDIPWITSADIVNIKTAEPRKYITNQSIRESTTNLIPAGNVIVVTRVGLGKLFKNEFDVCISQDSQGLIIKDGINADYLAYILRDSVANFKNISQGSTIQGVTKRQLIELQIPLPSLETQHTIIEEIESEQGLVDANRELIERMERKIKAAVGRVWMEEL